MRPSAWLPELGELESFLLDGLCVRAGISAEAEAVENARKKVRRR